MARPIQVTDQDRELLKELMLDLRLSGLQLAKLARVNRTWLQQVLSGARKTRVDSYKLNNIAAMLATLVRDASSTSGREQSQIGAGVTQDTGARVVTLPQDRVSSALLFLARF